MPKNFVVRRDRSRTHLEECVRSHRPQNHTSYNTIVSYQLPLSGERFGEFLINDSPLGFLLAKVAAARFIHDRFGLCGLNFNDRLDAADGFLSRIYRS